MAIVWWVILWLLVLGNATVFFFNARMARRMRKIHQAEFEILMMMWQMRYCLTPEQIQLLRLKIEFEMACEKMADEDG